MTQVNINAYQEFVEAVTSVDSNETESLLYRIKNIQALADENQTPLNVSLLMTGSIGLCTESGEFGEYVKKMLFQGKPYNEEIRNQMIKELGDVIWYWTNACRAIEVDPNDVIAVNVEKLRSRYTGGEFNVYESENRKPEDN